MAKNRNYIIMIILIIVFTGLLFFVNNGRNNKSAVSVGNEKKCGDNEYLAQCKLGPCCCPVGALCD